MKEKIEEQQAAGGEQSGSEPLTAEVAATVSDTGFNDVSEPDEAATQDPLPENPVDNERFREAVRKSAQSMKDKELASVYAELRNARKELDELRDARVEKASAEALAGRETAEQQAWGKTEDVGQFQTERRDLMARQQQLSQDTAGSRQVADRLQAEAKRQEATALAFKHLLPDDGVVISRVETLVKALMEAETPREMALLAQAKGKEMRLEGEKNRQRPKIDSSIHSAGGGLNVEKLSPSDKIAVGLEQVKRKQGRI
jgi:hypothetical protein